MGRWIRGPGTGNPRDGWKEKREVYGAWRMEKGSGAAAVPQPGLLPSPEDSHTQRAPISTRRPPGWGRVRDSPAAPGACSISIRSCSCRTCASRSRFRTSASCSWLRKDRRVSPTRLQGLLLSSPLSTLTPTWRSSGWWCGWPPARGSSSAW